MMMMMKMETRTTHFIQRSLCNQSTFGVYYEQMNRIENNIEKKPT